MAKPAYSTLDAGLSRIGRSAQMQQVCVDIAKRLEGNANAVGDSEYESGPEKVRTGWKNEARAGAVVKEKTHNIGDSLDAVLVRVTDAFAKRR